MKRRVWTLLVLLLLGALVNVAVAWGCSRTLRQRTRGMTWDIYGETGTSWAHYVLARPGTMLVLRWPVEEKSRRSLLKAFHETPQALQGGESDPPHWSVVRSTAAPAPVRGERQTHVELAAGWPMVSLKSMSHLQKITTGGHQHVLTDVHWGIALSEVRYGNATPLRILPLRPIWPGVALNTLFYAFILWLVFAAPFALRRWRRIKRGLCPTCAYPVGASDVCTECGTGVKQRSAVS